MCFAGKGSSWIQEHITGCNSFKGVTSRMVFRGCCGKYVHFWEIHFREIRLVLLHKAQLQEWCLGSVGSYITGLSHRPATFCLFCRQTVRVLVWGLNCGYLRDHLPLIFTFLHTFALLANFLTFCSATTFLFFDFYDNFGCSHFSGFNKYFVCRVEKKKKFSGCLPCKLQTPNEPVAHPDRLILSFWFIFQPNSAPFLTSLSLSGFLLLFSFPPHQTIFVSSPCDFWICTNWHEDDDDGDDYDDDDDENESSPCDFFSSFCYRLCTTLCAHPRLLSSFTRSPFLLLRPVMSMSMTTTMITTKTTNTTTTTKTTAHPW